MEEQEGQERGWLGRLAALGPWFAIALVLLAALPGIFAMPPIDRDESRFAQASYQMLESGNFLDIRFQDVPRNKKPVGIHWLQAASVTVFSSIEAKQIWPYRLSSLMGAVLAVFLVYSLGRRLVSPAAGALAALVLGLSPLLLGEALMAKTDAVLLATVLAAQRGLLEAWLGDRMPAIKWRLLFWVGLAAGILIKGPITPLVVLLTALLLSLSCRRWSWLKRLSPAWGLPLLLALAAPWYLYVAFGSDSDFFAGAVGKDLMAKVLGPEESHGLPPGFYLIAHLFFFLPGAFIALPVALAAWRRRRGNPVLQFCLAWLLPTWVLFELVPTKLPHYVLPAYPALALLIGWAITQNLAELKQRWVRLMQFGLALGGLLTAIGVIVLPFLAKEGFLWQSLPVALAAMVGPFLTLHFLKRGKTLTALTQGAVFSALFFAAFTGLYLPSFKNAQTSQSLLATYQSLETSATPHFAVSGYHEPSLVFISHEPIFMARYDQLGDYLAEHPDTIVAISTQNLPYLEADLARLDMKVEELQRLVTFSYTKGEWIEFIFYRPAP